MSILAGFTLLYMIFMIPISFYAARFVNTAQDYVLASRNLPFYMALSTVFAQWFGSESILGASASMAEGGFLNVLQDPFGAGLCLILIGLFFARRLYLQNHLTIGDYFQHRYNTRVGMLLSIAIAVTYFGWVAAQFVALGIIMQFVFGLPAVTGMLIAVGIVVIYTYIGGMWSVALHDLIQTFIIIVGLVIIFFQVMVDIGGFSALVAATPPEFFNLTPPEHTTREWLAFVAALLTIGIGSIPQQDVYQRVMSARTPNIAVWASVIGGILYFSVVLIPLFLGLAARMLYPELLSVDSQLLVPTLIQDHTSVFIQVIFYGALLSAIMSTASGALLAPASLIGENIIKPFFKNISDKTLLFLIKLSIIVVAAGAILMAIQQGDIYELVAGAYSITLVSAFVPLAAGLYWKKANALGAMLAVIFGAVAWQYVERVLGADFPVPSILVGLLMSVVGMLLGVLIEHVLRKKEREEARELQREVPIGV